MKVKKLALIVSIFGAMGLTASIAWSWQASAPEATVAVSMIVSVEAKHGKEEPVIYKEDVRVFHDRDRLPVKEWVPYRGDQAGLELYILIDDSSTTDVGAQLDDLRKFITAQPETTLVGVGYIRNDTVDVRQSFTKDHSLASKALRLPIGSAGAGDSPYTAVTDLIEHWPQSQNRRVIFMVSSGIDAWQPGPTDTYLDDAISRAQRAGVQVYSIYASPAGHFGHSFWRSNWGQNNLSRLADETGGEAYFQALSMPISYGPYLDQFAERLNHQYRLTFLAKVGKKPGFQKIRIETEVPNAELVAAGHVYVPAVEQ